MRRLITLLVTLVCSVTVTFAQYSGSGTGTKNDPYLIFNETQLSQMANFLNKSGVYFKLMKDLNLTDWISENNPSQGWAPVGVSGSPFKGILLGNNHKISGFTINRSQQDNVGFFGVINGATISDLTIEGTTVEGNNNVGAFCGSMTSGTFTNVRITVTSVEGSSYVGSFVGKATGSSLTTVSASLNSVSGTDHIGGFGGSLVSSTLQKVDVSNGTVNATTYVGGFAGEITSSTVTTSNVTGDITATGSYTGGYAGSATNATVSQIKVKGNIDAKDYVGGIFGQASRKNTISSNRYIGDISGTTNIGGISGYLVAGSENSFASCLSKGKITATGDHIGGIVGNSQGACIAKMDGCSHFGDIVGGSRVGGLIGSQESVATAPSLSTWKVVANYEGTFLDDSYSGLEQNKDIITDGSTINISINNCSAIGNLQGDDYIGGLVGYESSSYGYRALADYYHYTNKYYKLLSAYKDGRLVVTSYCGDINYGICYFRNTISYILSNSNYSGTINGNKNVGGLVGYKIGCSVQNCYTYGSVYGDQYVGGIVGQTVDGVGADTLKSNVAIMSTISATKSDLGRIYGKIGSKTTIGELGSAEGNKALATTRVIKSGVVQEVVDDSQNGSSIGQSALKLKATYVASGWNFDDNWNIQETECFPYKKYQAAPPVIESNLVSQATSIGGKSLNGGTVYLYYKDHDAVSTTCDGNKWNFNTEALQSGATVQIYADVDDLTPSYFTTATVKYPGSGTESDPYRVYTAADLQGASNKGYYKLMNDIDLTSWINENSPTVGWVPIGRNSGESTYFDGDGHKVTGLWTNTTQDYTGLFSNFSAGQIKNLNVEVAAGKSVKGGDYTGILIGRNANGKIVNCSVKGNVEGTQHVGGIAGYAGNTTLTSLTQDGKVTATGDNAFVGGMIGQTENCTVASCNVAPTINATGTTSEVGGLIGEAVGGSITKCVANPSLTANGKNSNVGGLVGKSSSNITLSISKGTVSASGTGSNAGGLVGYATAPIANSYSTATVSGTDYSAGLVGYTFSTIDKCYAKGNVSGVTYGAGIVGEMDGSSAALTNSVAANNILSLTAQSSWGSRVIGGYKNGCTDPNNSNYALSTMQVSLNSVPQKKTDDLVEGIAKTEAELMSSATYMGIGWDFSKTWGIDEGSIFPYLLWEVDVNPVADVTFDKTTMILPVGKKDTIQVSVLPLGATNKRLEWKSSNAAVATVTDGVVTAVAEGEATITGTTTDGSNISATCKVTVTKNKDAAIANLQSLVDEAQTLYTNSTEGSEIGQYASGARAALLKVINAVKAKISDTMSDEVLAQCVTDIQNAIDTFKSKQVTAGPDTDISKLNNTVYIENFEAQAGAIKTLSVKMKNTLDVVGLQFDLYLPDGLTFVKDENGDVEMTLSTGRTTAKRTDLFNSVIRADGSLRVLAASTKTYSFSGNDGEIIQIKVKVADNMKNGDYPIIFKNVELSSTKAKERQSFVKSTVSISSYKMGDVDNDGTVTVSDVVFTSSYILDGNPSPFIKAAADIDGDGEITVSDVVQICTLILHEEAGTVSAAAKAQVAYDSSSFGINPFVINSGSSQSVEVNLSNTRPVLGYQMDIALPEGISLQGVCLDGERMGDASSTECEFTKLKNGKYRILCYSMLGNAFNGNNGAIAHLTLVADNQMADGNYQAEVSNVIMAGENYRHRQNNFVVPFQVGSTTYVSRIGVDANKMVNVYGVDGTLVRYQVKAGSCLDNLPNGMYIVNGHKFIK